MLVPVKGNRVGAAPSDDTAETPAGPVAGGAGGDALVADTEPNPGGGMVLAEVAGGVGVLVAGASGGTAVVEGGGVQSSIVC
jgi:hypothetical protein